MLNNSIQFKGDLYSIHPFIRLLTSHPSMAAGIVSKSPPPPPFFSTSLSQNKSSTSSLTPQQTLYSSPKAHFHGFKLRLPQSLKKSHKGYRSNSPIQMSLRIPKAQRWWEKGVQKNMREVSSAQDLVSSLLYAGDQLVIVDFFSPGCGGCRALHPKICQFAEMNPDVQFLQINYEEHKSMCYSLNVHVLPFFRFYRGAHGRLCSFSCTNATIKKFKDALAKHTTERCSLGPTKGLEEAELLALAGNKDLNFDYTPNVNPAMEPLPANIQQHPSPLIPSQPIKRSEEEKALVTAGRN